MTLLVQCAACCVLRRGAPLVLHAWLMECGEVEHCGVGHGCQHVRYDFHLHEGHATLSPGWE